MIDSTGSPRPPLAERVRHLREEVAVSMTRDFFARHPDWREQFGERGWELGLQDARFHIDFLAGALESGRVSSFERYCSWLAPMLESRGIARVFVQENLMQLRDILCAAVAAEEQAVLREYADAGIAACDRPLPGYAEAEADDRTSAAKEVLLQAVLRGERKAAHGLAAQLLREGMPFVDLLARVFQEVLYEVGVLWQRNAISVAQEHVATVIIQYVMALLYSELPSPPKSQNRGLVTGVRGEHHQLGATMIADALESRGWRVRFLGTNLPDESILAAVQEHRPEIVCISATMLFNLSAVRDVVSRLRQTTDPSPRIFVGGALFRNDAALAARVGANDQARDVIEFLALLGT